MNGGDFIDVFVVHPISIPIVVEEPTLLLPYNADVSSPPNERAGVCTPPNERADVSSPLKDRADVSSPPNEFTGLSSSPPTERADVSSDVSSSHLKNRADVSSFRLFDVNENEDSDLNEEQSPRVAEDKPVSDCDALYDAEENIDNLSDLDEKLLEARQSNIQQQVRQKADRVNIDEIPSGPVGIDAGFEDIYKNKRGRFEGKLGGDDPYFDSSDSGSDISENEGNPIEDDEVVDPPPRHSSSKIYFDPTAKKVLF